RRGGRAAGTARTSRTSTPGDPAHASRTPDQRRRIPYRGGGIRWPVARAPLNSRGVVQRRPSPFSYAGARRGGGPGPVRPQPYLVPWAGPGEERGVTRAV